MSKGYFRFSSSATIIYDCSEANSAANCEGGSDVTGKYSCRHHSKGPLCSVCDSGRVKDSSGSCVLCSSGNFVKFAAWGIAFIVALTLVPALRTRYGKKLRDWAAKKNDAIHSAAINVRIILFNYQVVTKFTELNKIDWPWPFSTFQSQVMEPLALNVEQLLPSIQCFLTLNDQRMLLFWTFVPLVFLALGIVIVISARIGKIFRDSCLTGLLEAAGDVLGSTLIFISLIHTLIMVKILSVFDCESFELGAIDDDDGEFPNAVDGKLRVMATDYSVSCDTATHEGYQQYAIAMAIVYMFLYPLGTTYRRYANARRGESYYHSAFWWFDTFDELYRVAMTGFLLVVFSNSSKRRVISCGFIGTLFLMFIQHYRPFDQDSHNAVLISGQAIVVCTVWTGVVIKLHTAEGNLIGSILLILNVAIVGISVWQHYTERLYHIVEAINDNKKMTIDRNEFVTLWKGSARKLLCKALVERMEDCLEDKQDEKGSEKAWKYLTDHLFKLEAPEENSDGEPIAQSKGNQSIVRVWDLKLPKNLGQTWKRDKWHEPMQKNIRDRLYWQIKMNLTEFRKQVEVIFESAAPEQKKVERIFNAYTEAGLLSSGLKIQKFTTDLKKEVRVLKLSADGKALEM